LTSLVVAVEQGTNGEKAENEEGKERRRDVEILHIKEIEKDEGREPMFRLLCCMFEISRIDCH